MADFKGLLLFFLVSFNLKSTAVALQEGEGTMLCTSAHSKCSSNPHLALTLKLVSMLVILFAGAIGVCLPIVGKSVKVVQPESDAFFMVKAFAAGVIVSVGCIHILPVAFASLGSPCLKGKAWNEFPFAGFVFMLSMVATFMVDSFAMAYFKRAQLSKATPLGDEESERGNNNKDHSQSEGFHGPPGLPVVESRPGDQSQLTRDRVISQVLEFGVVVHSVIIGSSLGTSPNPCIVKTLMAALSFHQFFEGVGLGGCILQAKFKNSTTIAMAVFFSLMAPIGIGLGVGISSVYQENSPKALVVEGILNSTSAGILVYMALVDLLAADMMHPRMQNSGKLQLLANLFLLLGLTFMSILAMWA